MLNQSDHDTLVASFYASAMNEKPWTETLHELAEKFATSVSLIQVQGHDQQILSHDNHGYSREFSESFFTSDAFANDPRVPYFRAVTPGSIYYDHMLYDVDEMSANRWTRESIDILGVKYQLGAFIALPDNSVLGFAVLSTPQEGHATREAIDAFARLAPHVGQAVTFGHILEFQTATRSALLDALSYRSDGIILISRTGAPTFMNATASDILNGHDGLTLTDGRIHATRGPESRKLQSLVEAAIAASKSPADCAGGQTLVTRPSGRRPYVLRVVPAPGTERFLAGQSIACVIHIQDLDHVPTPSKDTLMQVFGLTERECDLATELVRCASLDRAAIAAGMAFNTARNHLQSTFRKTNTSAQSELVQLLGRLA
tara:strand:- start:315 stop:1433 length:1119 start_codon:yes stop_codon:yes gene_type:complete